MAYGASITIPNPWRVQTHGPKRPRVRVPPSEVEIRKAEDFLIGQLVSGPMDVKLVLLNAKRRRSASAARLGSTIRPSALTVAKKRLGIETIPTDWRRRGLATVPAMWDWRLPRMPTVAGAKAILRYRQRQQNSRQAQP